MMNSIIFNSNVINEKQNFNIQDIADLKEITEKYPYFQIAAMLYTKALLKTNNADYKKVLAKTATTVNNREQLFSYLYSDLYNADDTIDIEKPIAEPVEEKQIVSKLPSNNNFNSTTEVQNPKPIINDCKEIKNKKDLMQTIANNLEKVTPNKEPAKVETPKIAITKTEDIKIDIPELTVTEALDAKSAPETTIAKAKSTETPKIAVTNTEAIEVKIATKAATAKTKKDNKTLAAKPKKAKSKVAENKSAEVTDMDTEIIEVKAVKVKKKSSNKSKN